MVNVKRAVTIATVSIGRAAIVLSVGLTVAGAAHGDWLVLASGEAIETKGAWTLQGPRVIFTSTRGVLSSVRASEVNVERSRALTAKKSEQATQVVAPAVAPKRPPVQVFTDKDFSKAAPAPAPAAEGAVEGAAEGAVVGTAEGAGVATSEAAPGEAAIEGEGGAPASAAPAAVAADATAASAAAPAPAAAAKAPLAKQQVVPSADSMDTRVAYQMPSPPALRITSWSERPTGDQQISIFGAIHNAGAKVTAAVDITVALIDSEGRQIESAVAVVSSSALMPNAQADFEAKFEGEPNFAEIQFSVKTVEIEMSNPANEGRLEEPVGDEPHATSRTSVAKPKAPSS